MKRNADIYYHLYDGRGNVKALLDQNQSVVASYRYSPFGKLKAETGMITQPYQFSTKRFDHQTGLIYYGYRHYSPSIGRWTTRDPIGFAGGDINLYGFVQNNSVNRIDPDGRYWYVAIPVGLYLGYLAISNYDNFHDFLDEANKFGDNYADLANKVKNNGEGLDNHEFIRQFGKTCQKSMDFGMGAPLTIHNGIPPTELTKVAADVGKDMYIRYEKKRYQTMSSEE